MSEAFQTKLGKMALQDQVTMTLSDLQNLPQEPSPDETEAAPALTPELAPVSDLMPPAPQRQGTAESQITPPPQQSPGAEEHPVEEAVMTIVEHLDELRWRIFRCVGYVAAAFISALFFTKETLKFLEAPAGNITFQALSLEEPVVVFFKVAFYSSLIIASPLVLFEIARFVAPGLTKKERTIMAPIVVGSPILFVGGAAFAYFCLLPPMLHFFGAFGAGVSPIHQRLDFYVSLVSSILLYMGACFQLPIIIFALSFTGLVTSRMLISIWKYAFVACTVVAAVITPDPTAFSMILVMAALLTLYFLSVFLLKLFGR